MAPKKRVRVSSDDVGDGSSAAAGKMVAVDAVAASGAGSAAGDTSVGVAGEVLERLDWRTWIQLRPETTVGALECQEMTCTVYGIRAPEPVVEDDSTTDDDDGDDGDGDDGDDDGNGESGMDVDVDVEGEGEAGDVAQVCAAEAQASMPHGAKKPSGAERKPVFMAQQKTLLLSPALMKVIDEVLQNAADRACKDATMTSMEVTVNMREGSVCVRNDGAAIPITEVVEGSGKYWITALFSEQHTGGNFTEVSGQSHFQGGRNGIGAKATNALSKWFRVDVGDPVRQKRFVQEWTNHMETVSAPAITRRAAKRGYVCVEFAPDLVFFKSSRADGQPGFPDDVGTAIASRVWELAATMAAGTNPQRNIAVKLNGMRVALAAHGAAGLAHQLLCGMLYDRGELFALQPRDISRRLMKSTMHMTHAQVQQAAAGGNSAGAGAGAGASGDVEFPVWDVCVLHNAPDARTGKPAFAKGLTEAFVNGVACGKGTHVNTFFRIVSGAVKDAVVKRCRNKAHLTATQLNSIAKRCEKHLVVVICALLPLPRFKSQTKDALDSPVPYVWKPEDSFVRALAAALADAVASELDTSVETLALRDASSLLPKQRSADGRKMINVPKCADALTAGTRGTQAVLVLTEGDSAMQLPMAGRAVTGARDIGVYPLRGKMLNTREKTVVAVSGNKECMAVAEILGLTFRKVYRPEDMHELRYRYVWVLADQDTDGAHIVGLVVNFIHTCWPSVLVNWPDFLSRFATPIVIAKPKKTLAHAHAASAAAPAEREFLTLPQFRAWVRDDAAGASKHTVVYFKGLAGHDSKRARAYFANRSKYVITLLFRGAKDDAALAAFFSGDTAKRKDLLTTTYSAESFVDYTQDTVSIRAYLRSEALHHCFASNGRAICGNDGLKESQRKVVYALRRMVLKDQKVTDVASKVSLSAEYEHGDVSLTSLIIYMGQRHLGTNNLTLFDIVGAAGSRITTRDKSHGAPRYLKLCSNGMMDSVFPRADDSVHVYQRGENRAIVEPTVLLGVVPMDLVNGCNGIGTGWSTRVPPMHPLEVADACEAFARGAPDWRETADKLLPWYDCFVGEVSAMGCASWQTCGLYTVDADACTVHIVELPVDMWNNTFEEVLQPLLVVKGTGAKVRDRHVPPFIRHVDNRNTDTRVDLTLHCTRDGLQSLMEETAPPFEPDGRGFPVSANAGLLEAAAKVYAARQRRYPLLEAALHLQRSNAWSNMHRLDARGMPRHCETIADVVGMFGDARLQLYAARLQWQTRELTRQLERQRNFRRLCEEVISGSMQPHTYEDERAWWLDLAARGFTPENAPQLLPQPIRVWDPLMGGEIAVSPPQPRQGGTAATEGGDDGDDGSNDADEEEEDDAVAVPEDTGACSSGVSKRRATFAYLTRTRLTALTRKAIVKCDAEIARIAQELDVLRVQTPAGAWIDDLAVFRAAYRQHQRKRAECERIDDAGSSDAATARRSKVKAVRRSASSK